MSARLSADETETLRITTGERPAVRRSAQQAAADGISAAEPAGISAGDPAGISADETETVDLASRRGEVAPAVADERGEPEWFANGRRPGDHSDSNDQPRTGDGFGAAPRPSDSSEGDGGAPTEVLDTGPDPADQNGRDQQRSPGSR